MSRRTKNECGPQDLYNIAGQRPGNGNNAAQHGEVSGRREHEAGWPLPRKPVIHRRRPNARTQDSLDLCDLEKLTISKQTEGILPPQEDNSTGEINGFSHPSKDLREPQREDVEMGRLIHAKKLALLETILSFEEKVRQKLKSVRTTAGDDRKCEEETHNRAVWPQTRLPVQHRGQSVKQRGEWMEGGTHLRTKQRQRHEDRMKNTHEEKRDMRRVAGVRPEHRREVNDASTESKHRGKTYKGMYGSENVQETLQMTPHKTAHSLSKENHRGAEAFEGSSLPPISNASYSSRPQQEEMGLMRSTDADFHLLPCRICNRKFISGRLAKHVQVCKKVNKSHRHVFNSYINRTKGSAIEEFWKTHSRSKTPELFQPNHKINLKNKICPRVGCQLRSLSEVSQREGTQK